MFYLPILILLYFVSDHVDFVFSQQYMRRSHFLLLTSLGPFIDLAHLIKFNGLSLPNLIFFVIELARLNKVDEILELMR